MSIIEEPPTPSRNPADRQGDEAARQLAEMRHELDEQGKSIRNTAHAFAIFAVMALVIAAASLLAVAFKLQSKPKTVTVSSPAASTAVAAPLSPNVDVTLAQFAVTPG